MRPQVERAVSDEGPGRVGRHDAVDLGLRLAVQVVRPGTSAKTSPPRLPDDGTNERVRWKTR
jgi:hypothetical protein